MRFISDHVEMLTGYPASEFVQENLRPFESVICPADLDHVRGVVREALSRGDAFSLEYRVITRTALPGGSPNTVEVRPIPAGGRCG